MHSAVTLDDESRRLGCLGGPPRRCRARRPL